MIVIKFNGEVEEKVKTIALLEGSEIDEVVEYLKEIVVKEVERRYKEVVGEAYATD